MTSKTNEKPDLMMEQHRLGFTKPSPLWGFYWITPDGRRHVRVYDTETKAHNAERYALLTDPKTYANSWVEKE